MSLTEGQLVRAAHACETQWHHAALEALPKPYARAGERLLALEAQVRTQAAAIFAEEGLAEGLWEVCVRVLPGYESLQHCGPKE